MVNDFKTLAYVECQVKINRNWKVMVIFKISKFLFWTQNPYVLTEVTVIFLSTLSQILGY
jgi:hypothetical protein